jgi:preprotein translocase subunit YajC
MEPLFGKGDKFKSESGIIAVVEAVDTSGATTYSLNIEGAIGVGIRLEQEAIINSDAQVMLSGLDEWHPVDVVVSFIMDMREAS